jgi:hypothetical protein
MEKDEKRIMLILYTWEQDVLDISALHFVFVSSSSQEQDMMTYLLLLLL